MVRKLITAILSELQLKKLRMKSFGERNKIIQDGISKHQKVRLENIRKEKNRENFIF